MVDDELLANVLQYPRDDAPRLVYADWLQDHGDPVRAEFIRVQCQLARTGAPDPALQRREQELLAQHGHDWAQELGEDVIEWAFQRGFVERVGMSLERSTEELLRVLGKAPVLHLRDWSQMCELSGLTGALPQLSQLVGLELWGLYAFEGELVRELLLSPHLAGLETLILRHDRNGDMVDDEILVEGLHSPHRAHLRELAVGVDGSWRGPSVAVLEAIASSPHLRGLRKLDLSNAGDPGNQPQLTAAVAERLFSSPNLAQLEELDLRSVRAPRAAWDIIRRSLPPGLRRLLMADAGLLDARGGWRSEPAGWRASFEERVPDVDWERSYVDPWMGGVWSGQSWEGRKRELTLSIQSHLRARDPDGLEAAFHALCEQWSDPGDAERIAGLALDGWGACVGALVRRARGQSLALVLHEQDQWGGDLHVYASAGAPAPLEQFEPVWDGSYSPSNTMLRVPRLPEAATALSQCRPPDATRPHGPGMYLTARLLAAISRHLPEPCCPLYVTCRSQFRLR